MKWIPYSLCVVLALTFISCSQNDSSKPGFVVAQGKGIKITRGELTKERDEQIQVLNVSNVKIPDEQMYAIDSQILNVMIDKALMLNEITKNPSIKLDEEIEKTLKGIKSKFPTEEAFKEQLAKSNLTVEKIKNEIKFQVALEKIIQTKYKPEEINISDAEAEAFYKGNAARWNQPDLVKAQHVMVFVESSATEDVKKAKKKIIDDARQRVEKGENFEKVAAEVSEDPESKQKGGELPPFGKDSKSAPDFTETVFKQKVGQLGPVFSTRYGYHFAKVLEKMPAREIPFNEVKEIIKKKLEVDKKSKAIQATMKALRDQAEIKILLPSPKEKNPTPALNKQPVQSAPSQKTEAKK